MKQNKAEKLLAGVLSISLAMGVSVMPAFAASGETYADMDSVVIKKTTSWPTRGPSPRRRRSASTSRRTMSPMRRTALKPETICRLSAT